MYKSATRYFGDVATGYDDRQQQTKRWQREQDIVETYISTIAPGAMVADVPFGTGRFIPFYQRRNLSAFGGDVSPDMLAIAREKVPTDAHFQLALSTAEALPLPDHSIDYLLSHRFIKWLPNRRVLQKVMREFARVTQREMLIQVKILSTHKKKRGLKRVLKWLRQDRTQAKARAITQDEFERIMRSCGWQIGVTPCPDIDVSYFVLRPSSAA